MVWFFIFLISLSPPHGGLWLAWGDCSLPVSCRAPSTTSALCMRLFFLISLSSSAVTVPDGRRALFLLVLANPGALKQRVGTSHFSSPKHRLRILAVGWTIVCGKRQSVERNQRQDTPLPQLASERSAYVVRMPLPHGANDHAGIATASTLRFSGFPLLVIL